MSVPFFISPKHASVFISGIMLIGRVRSVSLLIIDGLVSLLLWIAQSSTLLTATCGVINCDLGKITYAIIYYDLACFGLGFVPPGLVVDIWGLVGIVLFGIVKKTFLFISFC